MRVDLLREVGWFEALPPLVKAQLALDIEVVELKSGDKLFSTGDPIDSVHYVILVASAVSMMAANISMRRESGSWPGFASA